MPRARGDSRALLCDPWQGKAEEITCARRSWDVYVPSLNVDQEPLGLGVCRRFVQSSGLRRSSGGAVSWAKQ